MFNFFSLKATLRPREIQLVFLLLGGGGALGCVQVDKHTDHTSFRSQSTVNRQIEHLGSFTLSCQNKVRNDLQDFGGISSLSYYQGYYYMLTEGHPYIYKVLLDTQSPHLDLKILEKITLSGAPQSNLSKLEAMAACHDYFIVGSEGIPREDMHSSGSAQDIFLFMTSMDGQYIREIPIPNALLMAEGKGTLAYRGIQGLSCSPKGQTLLVSLQSPLKQDTTADLGPTSRHLLFNWDSNAEAFYFLKSIYAHLSGNLGLMGSELINETGTAIILEGSVPVSSSIYVVDTKYGDDISDCDSLRANNNNSCGARIPATKYLLTETIERFSGQDLDIHEVQYDAIGIGPKQNDGRHTIILATDDDHCGSISNSMATEGLGFSGTTFSIFAVDLSDGPS